jgi:signal peptidase I
LIMDNKNKVSITTTLIYGFLIVALTLICTKYVAQRTVVDGNSMYPTLYNGDSLIVNKLAYMTGDPQRFDIVIFPVKYDRSTFFIKRIIGLPGETVRIDDAGSIYINGKKLNEHYGRGKIQDPGLAAKEVKLGDDEYFVMGDNRNFSEDSRFDPVGNIKRKDIAGKITVRIYPLDRYGYVNCDKTPRYIDPIVESEESEP